MCDVSSSWTGQQPQAHVEMPGTLRDAVRQHWEDCERSVRVLEVEQRALQRRLERVDETNRQSVPACSLGGMLQYLAKCRTHPSLGVPMADPLRFMEWIDAHEGAVILTLGRQLPEVVTGDAMGPVLAGEIMAQDGPFEGGMAQTFSQRQCQAMETTDEAAIQMRTRAVTNNMALNSTHRGVVSSWAQGDFRPVIARNVMYHAQASTSYVLGCFLLVIAQMPKDPSAKASDDSLPPIGRERIRKLLTRDGHPRIMMVIHVEPDLDVLDPRVFAGSLRDHMALQHVPAAVLVCNEKGHILSQNTASIAQMGVQAESKRMEVEASAEDSQPINYLLELFGSQEAVANALDTVTKKGIFRDKVCISSPTLLDLMNLPRAALVYHDVSISKLRDGVVKQMVYIIAQVDVSDTAAAEDRVQRLQVHQDTLLRSMLPPQVIDVLLEQKKTTGRMSLSTLAAKASRTVDDSLDIPTDTTDRIGTSGTVSPLVSSSALLTRKESDLLKSVADLESPGLHADEFSLSSSSAGRVNTLTVADVGRLSTYHDQVTIVFADIEDFTEVTQKMHPTGVVLFLNELFSAFDALLAKHDVYKIETIGDQYMACAGLFEREDSSDQDSETPHDNSNSKDILGGSDPLHANKALRFAKALVAVARSLMTPTGQPVRLRVGVNSGPIVTGVVGTRMPRFCCFGDTVNTASRMQSTSTAGVIHASASFHDLTPDESWEPTGGVEVKGKGHMETYVLGYSPQWADELD